ncbi:MAG: KAP family NTPase, partial [Candidatus Mariimomonas ferrooxydans]
GNNNHPEEHEMRFLSDQPLDADKEQEMRFGHLGIVDTLKNIVSTCPTPFTIGLFGKWGTGKTTIVNALKRKLHGSEIAAITIDAWKHEGDALRRTFLQDTIIQLQEKQDEKQYLSKEVKLSENLRVPISRTFRSEIINYSLIWHLVIALAVLIVVGILINIFSSGNLGTYISTVSGGGLIAGILIWLLQQSVTTETVTTTTDRFQDPQEFESEFKAIIGEVVAGKLLVIIDNLDRVSCDKAIELLSTIKTFLEQQKCVFLIACD